MAIYTKALLVVDEQGEIVGRIGSPSELPHIGKVERWDVEGRATYRFYSAFDQQISYRFRPEGTIFFLYGRSAIELPYRWLAESDRHR